jgi:hypothetical protein
MGWGMQLHTFEQSSFGRLARSRIKQVWAGKLYYLFNGRNAWHSTWVSRYTPGCMHTDLMSAKDTAERQRTQGSVFNIEELPALFFQTAAGLLAVTEINTHRPLHGYSSHAVGETPPGVAKIRGARDFYLETGAPLLGAALSFEPSSRFWRHRPPFKNSVIVVASSSTNLETEALGRKPLHTYQSRPIGGYYRLGWSIVPARDNRASATPVRALARQYLQERLDGAEDALTPAAS